MADESLVILVREATFEDAPAIAELAAELGYPNDASAVRARLAQLHASSDDYVALAQLPSGAALGWVHVGRRLAAAAEQWCRGQALRDVRVRSNVLRVEAHAFYPALGYRLAKSQHV